MGVSAHTGKSIKSVLANNSNNFRIKLQEIFLIHCDEPQLNKASDVILMLFS